MNEQKLIETARALVADAKGLLAMDESTATADKRFKKLGVAQTPEMHRQYRDMIVTTPKLSSCISGAILYDETIRQKTNAGVPFADALVASGIVPGIKVDAGAHPLAGHEGEKVTEGLDGLRDRLAEYAKMGARFAKWRAVITIGNGIPSRACLAVNANGLARYAALCQEAGLVPVVEPEVLMDGDHTLERCAEVTAATLQCVFDELDLLGVLLEGMLLKPNMVLPGKDAKDQSNAETIAEATVTCFLRHVPAAVPGISFLSGGQSSEHASARLNAMNVAFAGRMPWALGFSFARAIQQPALDIWRGESANVEEAQAALFHRADCNRAARLGRYDAKTDRAADKATEHA